MSEDLQLLLKRHRDFWQRADVSKPLLRVRPYRPLSRGGGSSETVRGFADGARIVPDKLTDENLLGAEPSVLVEGDLLEGANLPGICWTEAFFGCPIEMGEGGVWADSFLKRESDVTARLREGIPDDDHAWLAMFRRATELLRRRAGGRYPLLQPLMRGPVDMLAAAWGHQAMATAFYDCPKEAGELLDLCTSLFIKMADTHLALIEPFQGGYVTYGIWASGPTIRTQLDNAVLLSPAMYREHYLPRDRCIFNRYENVVIHVHSGSLHVAPDLAAEPDLNAIQVSLDMPAGPSLAQMLPLLAEIQDARPLIVTGPATRGELDLLLERLRPAGLCLDVRVQ